MLVSVNILGNGVTEEQSEKVVEVEILFKHWTCFSVFMLPFRSHVNIKRPNEKKCLTH